MMAFLRLRALGQLSTGCADVVDAVVGGVLEVVPDFGVEEQGLGGDAADVEAGSAELVGALDERGLEAKLAGADGCGVTGGSAPMMATS